MLPLARVQIFPGTRLLGTHGVPGTVLNALRTSLHTSVRYVWIHTVRPTGMKPEARSTEIPGSGTHGSSPFGSSSFSPRCHLGRCQGNLLPSSLHLLALFASH